MLDFTLNTINFGKLCLLRGAILKIPEVGRNALARLSVVSYVL